MKVTGTVTKFHLKSNFPIPVTEGVLLHIVIECYKRDIF